MDARNIMFPAIEQLSCTVRNGMPPFSVCCVLRQCQLTVCPIEYMFGASSGRFAVLTIEFGHQELLSFFISRLHWP